MAACPAEERRVQPSAPQSPQPTPAKEKRHGTLSCRTQPSAPQFLSPCHFLLPTGNLPTRFLAPCYTRGSLVYAGLGAYLGPAPVRLEPSLYLALCSGKARTLPLSGPASPLPYSPIATSFHRISFSHSLSLPPSLPPSLFRVRAQVRAVSPGHASRDVQDMGGEEREEVGARNLCL